MARQVIAFAIVELVITSLAFVFAGWQTALWVLLAGAVAIVLFAGITYRRHVEIRRLSAEIDEMLHETRTIDFSNCSEGDLAVLRNELSKMVVRLNRTALLLKREKSALSDSLADISHQIRTPLTAISLMIPVIERTDDESLRIARLHDLERMIEEVSWLVAALLKLAKLDAGAFQLERKDVSVARLVDRACSSLLISFDLRDVRFVRDVPSDCLLSCDMAWTAEAVGNILKNCMEHTPAGGEVRLVVREDALACRITITDTGSGIASEDIDHIFDRFYSGKFDEPNKEALDVHGAPVGFGIGLSLSQALISAQGGSIRASNAEQGGAQFEIVFPKMTV